MTAGNALGPQASSASKRVLDIVFSLAGLLVTAPAWILIPLAIKLEDGGAVFFAQPRVGRGGERFVGWKFRSMRPLDDYGKPPLQAHLEGERITRVGRVIRPTALDELPQLLSILRGHMSLVGPRALAPEETVGADGSSTRVVRLEDVPGFEERHSIRPGLTGLAQVRAPRDAPHRVRFRYDLLYVRRRTLWLDVKLIAWSVWTSLAGRWPSAGRGRRIRARPPRG
jgi:lipopolysaccharide/colanic/teichoic acid biosynthesis glycosyltransferase